MHTETEDILIVLQELEQVGAVGDTMKWAETGVVIEALSIAHFKKARFALSAIASLSDGESPSSKDYEGS